MFMLLVQFFLLDQKSACFDIWRWKQILWYLNDLLFVTLFLLYFFAMWCKATVSFFLFLFLFPKQQLVGIRGEESQRGATGSLRLFILCSGGEAGVMELGWGSTGSIKLDKNHCKRTQTQRTLLLFLLLCTHRQAHTHIGEHILPPLGQPLHILPPPAVFIHQ